jgi:hypothetical protein
LLIRLGLSNNDLRSRLTSVFVKEVPKIADDGPDFDRKHRER